MDFRRNFRRTHQDRLEDVRVRKDQPQYDNRVNGVKQQEFDHKEHFRTVLAVAGLVTLK